MGRPLAESILANPGRWDLSQLMAISNGAAPLSEAVRAQIRAALPDSVAGLAAVLPSLRTGEAIISGEAVVLPSRILIRRPDPLPLAEDPSLQPWRDKKTPADVAPALAAWREAYTQ